MDEIKKDINRDLLQYRQIMKNYQKGQYGSQNLHLDEILFRAGEPNLLGQMTLEELNELIATSFGMTRELFIARKNELLVQSKDGVCLSKKPIKTNNHPNNL